jgi:hypothetical protein
MMIMNLNQEFNAGASERQHLWLEQIAKFAFYLSKSTIQTSMSYSTYTKHGDVALFNLGRRV